jgi:methionyl-tRNA formyltransferase
MQVRTPAVKALALELGLPVFQPAKVRDGALQAWLVDRQADAAVVMAYGRILPPDVLATPRLGCINLHASLLPRHRGAAPIQWALLAGDEHTGISLMKMDEGLDSGPVYYQKAVPILPTDDGATLADRLGQLAADVVISALPRVFAGELQCVQQQVELLTLAPPISHADQVLDFSRSASEIQRRIRAFAPRPGAVTQFKAQRQKLLWAELAGERVDGPPGRITLNKRRILVATGDGTLELTRLQFEGKPPQSASDAVIGRRFADNEVLGERLPAAE